MENMDIYDVGEHIISSDEYSEDDEESLINVAISAKKCVLSKLNQSTTTKVLNNDMKYKNNEVQTSIKAGKLASIAKKRSVNWLNNKMKREKYKEIILKIKKTRQQASVVKSLQTEFVSNPLSADLGCIAKHIDKMEKPSYVKTVDLKNAIKDLTDEENIQENCIVAAKVNLLNEKKGELFYANKKKRSRSISPALLKCSEMQAHEDKKITNNNSLLCKEVNKLFPRYNKVLKNFVSSSSESIESLELKITQTLIEIQSLSDMIHTKELEWNKLLHLRKVKEEIVMHLSRKKNVLELKEKHNKSIHFCNINKLKLNTSESCIDQRLNSSHSPSSAHSLVENRANMKKEDLEKEQRNINRLHSILVSGNILPSSKKINSGVKTLNTIIEQSYKQVDQSQKRERETTNSEAKLDQHETFKDAKKTVADLRRKNPYIIPTVGRKIIFHDNVDNKINIDNTLNEEFLITPFDGSFESPGIEYSPTLQKLIFEADGKKWIPKRNKTYNDVIIPIQHESSGHFRSERFKDVLFQPSAKPNRTSLYQDSVELRLQNSKNAHFPNNNPEFNENEVPLCQACKIHEARFVCADCGNQWYCSRNCQVSAWDKHADICKN